MANAIDQNQQSTDAGSQNKEKNASNPVATPKPLLRYKRQSGFALTLAGGGARGAAHIGVLNVLSWMKMSSFEHDELQSAIEAGEIAARKALPKIKEYQTQNHLGAFAH